MSRRIIPVLCALAVAVVPATALAQPAQDPSPAVTRGGVVYGDTKYDLQNQQDQAGTTAYEQAISGDTKGDLPRAIAPAGTPAADARHARRRRSSAPTASNDDSTNGWQIAAMGRGRRPRGLRARCGRPRGAPPAPRSPHGGVEERVAEGAGPHAAPPPRHLAALPALSAPDTKELAPCSSAASWPAPARCASPSPPPPPPRTCGTSATSTTPPRSSPTGDTKNDLPGTVTAVLAGDTKGRPARRDRADARVAQHGRGAAGRPRSAGAVRTTATDGWQLAAVIEAGLLAAFALGAAVVDDGPPAPRSPHGGVEERTAGGGAARGPALTASASGTGAGRARGSSAAPRARRGCRCAATRAGPARSRGAARG